MRLSRGCYDKFHRCPGWNGGGPKYAKDKYPKCNNGRIQVDYQAKYWRYKFWPCNTCDVVVWPYAARYLSIFWLWYELKFKVRDMIYMWRNR